MLLAHDGSCIPLHHSPPLPLAKKRLDCYEPLVGFAAGRAVWGPRRVCLLLIHDSRAKCLKNLSRRGQQQTETKGQYGGETYHTRFAGPGSSGAAPAGCISCCTMCRSCFSSCHASETRAAVRFSQSKPKERVAFCVCA